MQNGKPCEDNMYIFTLASGEFVVVQVSHDVERGLMLEELSEYFTNKEDAQQAYDELMLK